MRKLILALFVVLSGCENEKHKFQDEISTDITIEYTVEVYENEVIIIDGKKFNPEGLTKFVSDVMNASDPKSLVLFYLKIEDGVEYKFYEIISDAIISGGGYPARKREKGHPSKAGGQDTKSP